MCVISVPILKDENILKFDVVNVPKFHIGNAPKFAVGNVLNFEVGNVPNLKLGNCIQSIITQPGQYRTLIDLLKKVNKLTMR